MPAGTLAAPRLPGRALLDDIAARVGTPVYVYDAARIREACAAFTAALAPAPHAVHYALKANSTLALVRLIRRLGLHADANSGGEIEVALRAGFLPGQIVFTGVGKTGDELDRAVSLDLKAINAESPGELDRIAARARAAGTTVRVALRVNPDIDAQSHPHISTGLRTNKFGMPIEEARAIYRDHARQEGLEAVGVHVHVGSQITSVEPLRRAAERVVALARELRDDGFRIEHVDLGGGLGISYDGSPVPGAAEYAAAILPVLRDTGLTVIVEPGRAIVGAAGALLARVVDLKTYGGGPAFAVLDAGMTELMRPALYNAFHRIVAVSPRQGAEKRYEVVGPLCESSDIFGRDRLLPPLEVGDLVAILDAGAYGSVMANTYNRRPLLPEVLVDGDAWTLIRRRQTIDDLLALEL
ncbi:MAG TPA: diaminopimelate decarboxylase [Vicinamibacterales bacterium]